MSANANRVYILLFEGQLSITQSYTKYGGGENYTGKLHKDCQNVAFATPLIFFSSPKYLECFF